MLPLVRGYFKDVVCFSVFTGLFLPPPVISNIYCVFTFSGARTVVHPKARIIAEAGPIVIGEGNLIEEQVLIINR